MKKKMENQMKSLPVVLRIYGEQSNDQWSLICLDFNLAVQADTLPEARDKLHQMIKSYLRDALDNGPDADQAYYFLTRRAPASFWVKYYIGCVLKRVFGSRNGRHLIGSDIIPMLPSGA